MSSTAEVISTHPELPRLIVKAAKLAEPALEERVRYNFTLIDPYVADASVLKFGDGLHSSSFAAAATREVPVISNRGESIEPDFRHGGTVVLCPQRDAHALAGAIQGVMDEPRIPPRASP